MTSFFDLSTAARPGCLVVEHMLLVVFGHNRNVPGVMCNMWLILYKHVDIIFCWWATLGAGLGITFYFNKFTDTKIQYDIVCMWL